MNKRVAKNQASEKSCIELAKSVLLIEANAVEALAHKLDDHFTQAVTLILHCQGRIVVSGIGKSGHIANKIAATFASTGTPAFFLHPAEASHGDLGMITGDDVIITLSNSGESDELLAIIPSLKRLGCKLINITGNRASTLAKEADIHLDAQVEVEACPLGLAPTASSTAMLALGDALAVSVLEKRGFSAEDFARSHPGGALGKRLLVRVQDVMRDGDALPFVAPHMSLKDALLEMSQKGLGMTAIVDKNHQVQGIFTDGDLRRALENGIDLMTTPIEQLMHRAPKSVRPDQLAVIAVEIMEENKVNVLLVTNPENQLVGAVNMHDLLIAKVV
jgi:arabinose-5-phosphate isomerase